MPVTDKARGEVATSDVSLTPALVRAAVAWLIPGAGHWHLKKRRRGVFYLLVVLVCVACGVVLQGRIESPIPGQPLGTLATLGTMGSGVIYWTLKLGGYRGDLLAQSYEYGTAFLITAGVMNWLLVLDVWDIALGRKD